MIMYMIGSLDPLNSDCRSFSQILNLDAAAGHFDTAYLKTMKPSVRLAIYTALLVAWQLLIDIW